MWLPYGINQHGELIHIDAVVRGRSPLVCPYCGVGLLARKGLKVVHHFAHDGPTCHPAARAADVPTLPCYDQFLLSLTGKEWDALQRFRTGAATPWEREHLTARGFLRYNPYAGLGGRTELTKLGQIPFGLLSLRLFCEVQEPLIAAMAARLDAALTNAWETSERAQAGYLDPQAAQITLREREMDVRLYRAQWRRILSLSLYCIEVQHEQGTRYKIGVTGRAIEERLPEIAADLAAHGWAGATLTVLGVWPQRGNVELYFKHRYAAYRAEIGSLTEYFAFDDAMRRAVLRDLRRIPKKVLTPDEEFVLADQPSPAMATITATLAQRAAATEEARRATERRTAIRTGMDTAKARGVHVGRPRGSHESPEVLLAKPSTQAVLAALRAGHSLRHAAATAGVAVNTVRKIKAWLAEHQEPR